MRSALVAPKERVRKRPPVRAVIEPDPARPRYVQTVWGYGYVFVPDGKP
mgnify:CR=1 FL=1